jgi:RNA polymerase sigma factor (sigma-70 family)
VGLSAASEDLLREAAPRVLAALVRRFGDFADCEDAVQEALIAAAEQWPREGTPENPSGWLLHVASRRLTDRIRSDSARRGREQAQAAEPAPAPISDEDDSLVLMTMCCHPALTPSSQIALTLRAVGGLTTGEIASAFLVPEATMAQRISRAKQTIKAAPEPFAMPVEGERVPRLRSLQRVLYLVFNEGYVASGGAELARAELSMEAIRLARIAHAALPSEPELTGLLALLLLTEARRTARETASGGLIPLDEQDHSLWDRALIAEGVALLEQAVARGAVGEYQLQAAIAAEHCRAERAEDTNWVEVLGLYTLLERVTGNPLVSLNRAVAVAMVDGPEAGLAALAPLTETLGDNHRLAAVRAHLLERAGEPEAARGEYERAARLTNSVPERNYLTKRAAALPQAGS